MVLEVFDRSVQLVVLVPGNVGGIGSDDVEWPPYGEQFGKCVGVTDVGMQGNENAFSRNDSGSGYGVGSGGGGCIGKWSKIRVWGYV